MSLLYPFQKQGVKGIAKFKGRALLADEMGLGKTRQALWYIAKRKRKRFPAIIVCPAFLKYAWQEEMGALGIPCEILNGRTPPIKGFDLKKPVVIINYEILGGWLDYLCGLQPAVVIWDESHYVANPISQRSQNLKDLLWRTHVKRRIAISGTPLTNRPIDLWFTLYLLRPDKFKSRVDYGFKYCKPKLIRGRWEFKGAKNTLYLHAKLKELLMIRRLKDEVYKDLPPKKRIMITTDLSPKHRKEYDFCHYDFMRWLKRRHPAKVFRAKKAPHLVQLQYLMGLLAKQKRKTIANWIENFFEESERKLIVFSGRTKTIDYLCEKFGERCVRIDGKVQGIKRKNAVRTFQKDPKKVLAVCNPRAAGVGLTLHAASNVLMADLPMTPGVLTQAEDRIHRIGQKLKCFIWYLLAKDTVEEKLCGMLLEKQDILNQVLDAIENGKDLDIFKELINSTKPIIKGKKS